MKRAVKSILLVFVGVLLCIGARLCLLPIFARRFAIAQMQREGMTENDIAMLAKIQEAFKRHDVSAINKALQINPGEIELIVKVCPVYPNGFCPIARISLKNVSTRSLVILKPRITRLTSPSSNHHGRLCDDYEVDLHTGWVPDWCRHLEPNQVFALHNMDLPVEGSGLHEVHFILNIVVFKSISAHENEAEGSKVSEATVTFTVEKPIP